MENHIYPFSWIKKGIPFFRTQCLLHKDRQTHKSVLSFPNIQDHNDSGESAMRKQLFWLTMCLISIFHGFCFYQASAYAMNCGISNVDNQAALLFIPFLWVFAVGVLCVINGYAYLAGRKIGKSTKLNLLELFCLSGLTRESRSDRFVFFSITFLCMLLGYWLFAIAKIWSLAYALSGGAYLIFLYTWLRSSKKE